MVAANATHHTVARIAKTVSPKWPIAHDLFPFLSANSYYNFNPPPLSSKFSGIVPGSWLLRKSS